MTQKVFSPCYIKALLREKPYFCELKIAKCRNISQKNDNYSVSGTPLTDRRKRREQTLYSDEAEMARRERSSNRLFIVIIVLIALLVGTNAIWIIKNLFI